MTAEADAILRLSARIDELEHRFRELGTSLLKAIEAIDALALLLEATTEQLKTIEPKDDITL